MESFMSEIIGIIGGSGLGDELGSAILHPQSVEMQTPFGKPSGPILIGRMGAGKIAFINRHARGHALSPSNVPYAANIYALKELGVRAVIATAAVGSLREEIHPRDLVAVDQIIDKTTRRRSSFFTDSTMVMHCELAHPFCNRIQSMLVHAGRKAQVKTHFQGTYVCMEGPQFSTRAESLLHRSWGGDLIGMTASPEFKLAREAQLCYALLACVSDYDCWRPHEAQSEKHALLKEIYGNLSAATANAIKLLNTLLSEGVPVCDDQCPCRKSLELASWTSADLISDDDRAKFKVLFD